jgi:hypothetical protein
VSGEDSVASSLRVKSAFRLGAQREDPVQQPRPLKVVLSTAEEVQAILKRKYRLKGQAIRILRDLSPEDRTKLREALASLRERRANGETDLFIRDFRVLHRKPRIRWIPLSLTHMTEKSETKKNIHPAEGMIIVDSLQPATDIEVMSISQTAEIQQSKMAPEVQLF